MNRNADQAIENLVTMMAKLPGLGPRSARRAVLHLIKKREHMMAPLSQALNEVAQNVQECTECGNVGTEKICRICANPKRMNGQLCVVENVSDLWAMERAAVYGGRYYVLGGVLSALDGVDPIALGIPQLVDRAKEMEITEVILALNATIDGQTTAHYISDQFGADMNITSLAQGVPIGGELDYLDDGTITMALNARKSF